MILNDYSQLYLQCGKVSEKSNDSVNKPSRLRPDVRLFEKKMSLLKMKHLNSYSHSHSNITAPSSCNTKDNHKEPFQHHNSSNPNETNSKQQHIVNTSDNGHHPAQLKNETHFTNNKPSRNSQPHSSHNNNKTPPSLKTWNISTIKNINGASIMNSYSSIHKHTKTNDTNTAKRKLNNSNSCSNIPKNNNNELSSLKMLNKTFVTTDYSFYEQFGLFYKQFQINESMLQQYLTLYTRNYIDKITNKIKHNANLLLLIDLWEHIGTSYIVRKHYLDYLLSKPKNVIPLLIEKEIRSIEQYKSKTNGIIGLIKLNEAQNTSNGYTVDQIKNELHKLKPLKVLWKNIDYELLLCYNEWQRQPVNK